jgi:release factor glutamine methyltransferase
MTIAAILQLYSNKLNYFDLELLLANSLNKTREFILIHPEYKIPNFKIKNLKLKISRRMQGEPIAYILGRKEFYGLDFKVNTHTLIPRPETEQLVELTLDEISNFKLPTQPGKIKNLVFLDIGTGSGCIPISIAHNIEHGTWNIEQKSNITILGSDISSGALLIAKKNATIHKVNNKIKFLKGNLLQPFVENYKLNPPAGGKNSAMIVVANLPYLSKEIYNSAPIDVKKFEPKSALYSPEEGLQHYRKLLEQIKELLITGNQSSVTVFLEISPEQKKNTTILIKKILPSAKIHFFKDLAGKWRIIKITL